MPRASTNDRLSRLEKLLGGDRLVDALLEVRLSTGEKLYEVGGLWDTTAGRFVTPPPGYVVKPHVVKLKKSEDEIGAALARYIDDRAGLDPDRILILMGQGERGGGKTFVLGLTHVTLALKFPKTFQGSVNIKASQRREVIDAIEICAAKRWIVRQVDNTQDPQTVFITRVVLLWFTSKNPAALRQAGLPFEYVSINEGQDQPVRVFNNTLFAVRKLGGLVGIATNPPQIESGEWPALVQEGIQLGVEDGGICGEQYHLPAADNDAIDQITAPKIAAAIRYVDKAAYEADVLGLMKLSGDLGYSAFSALPRKVDPETGKWISGHVGRPPDIGWTDVTRELTAAAMRSKVGYDNVGGCDFQQTPGTCGSVIQFWRDEFGELVMYVRQFIGTPGTEQDLSQAFISAEYYPGPVDLDGKPAESMMLVGDGTGANVQDATHRKGMPYSFTQLKAHGWKVLPPMVNFHTGNPCNPGVIDSRKQMHLLFSTGRIMFDPECGAPAADFPSLLEGFKRTKVHPSGKFVKKGHFTHGPDGVRYAAWRFMPRPRVERPGGVDKRTLSAMDRIAGILKGKGR